MLVSDILIKTFFEAECIVILSIYFLGKDS